MSMRCSMESKSLHNWTSAVACDCTYGAQKNSVSDDFGFYTSYCILWMRIHNRGQRGSTSTHGCHSESRAPNLEYTLHPPLSTIHHSSGRNGPLFLTSAPKRHGQHEPSLFCDPPLWAQSQDLPLMTLPGCIAWISIDQRGADMF